MDQLTHLMVNEVSVEWDERPMRKARPCANCRRMTEGRMKVTRNGETAVHVLCIKCFPARMADAGLKPVGQAIRGIHEALGGSQA